jgi:hypothetical protein
MNDNEYYNDCIIPHYPTLSHNITQYHLIIALRVSWRGRGELL